MVFEAGKLYLGLERREVLELWVGPPLGRAAPTNRGSALTRQVLPTGFVGHADWARCSRTEHLQGQGGSSSRCRRRPASHALPDAAQQQVQSAPTCHSHSVPVIVTSSPSRPAPGRNYLSSHEVFPIPRAGNRTNRNKYELRRTEKHSIRDRPLRASRSGRVDGAVRAGPWRERTGSRDRGTALR